MSYEEEDTCEQHAMQRSCSVCEIVSRSLLLLNRSISRSLLTICVALL
jgi:hypothetical protein